MKHKKTVENYSGSLKDLAEDVGNLHYESLKTFLKHLSTKLEEDAKKDLSRGRTMLADNLQEASDEIMDASKQIDKAWNVSRPHMAE